METLSEQLFEKLCTQYGVRFRCLCETQSKTPDYLILLEKTRVIVEIKQFDMRGEDELIWEKVNEGQTVAYFPDTVKRIRKDIKRASKQIKLPNSKPCPKVIILYDNTGGESQT